MASIRAPAGGRIRCRGRKEIAGRYNGQDSIIKKIISGGTEMKKRRKGKRLLAAALSILPAVTSLPTPAFAKGQTGQGLCERHPEHTNACYTDDLICGYSGFGRRNKL